MQSHSRKYSANLSGKFNLVEYFDIVSTTHFGLEEVCAKEIEELGASDIQVLTRAVRFRGNLKILYKANLLLRTAVKVLKPIKSFKAENEQELYDQVKQINWEDYFSLNKTFAIDGSVSGSIFTHSQFVALKSKDAVADRFREKNDNLRPNVNVENPDLRINIHIQESDVTVSLDSSGTTLGKRNYRLEQTEAPISEVLAAGIILLTGWDKTSDFIDPMCGSGTFAIEAALMANNIPPGRNRQFGFEKWIDFNDSLWKDVKLEADENIIDSIVNIYASDIDANAIAITSANAKRADVLEYIELSTKEFFQSSHTSGSGLIVMNPPYGERLQVDEIVNFYKEIGSRLKHFYEGCDAWIISSHYEGLKHFGLKASRKIKLYNGPLECRLNKYELYRGSKKTAQQVSP